MVCHSREARQRRASLLVNNIMGGNGTSAHSMHNTVCTINTYVCTYIYIYMYMQLHHFYTKLATSLLVYAYMVNSLWWCMFSVHERLVLDNVSSMHQIECFLPCVLNCMCVSCQFVHCSPFPLPPCRCLHCYHCLFGGTVGCHRNCIRNCNNCVVLADLQAETERYARPYGWHRNESFNMQLPSAGSPFLFQSSNRGL